MKSCHQPLLFSLVLIACGKSAVPVVPDAIPLAGNQGSGDVLTENGSSPAQGTSPESDLPAETDGSQLQVPSPVTQPLPIPEPTAMPAPTPVPEAVPTPVPAIDPQNCKAGRSSISKLKLLSPNVNLRLANQKLRFEATLLNCADGKVIPIRNQAISFDVDLVMATTQANQFEAFHPTTAASLEKGALPVFDGADINGPMAGYYHWKGAKMNLPAALDKVILEVTFGSAFDTSTTATSMQFFIRLDESDLGTATVPVIR